MPGLKLENVSYQYKNGDRKVVNAVTCLFEGGKLNAVVGPSGSGKTTLLSLMAGLDQPTQGQIFIDAEPLADLDLDQYRRRAGIDDLPGFPAFSPFDRPGKCLLPHAAQRCSRDGDTGKREKPFIFRWGSRRINSNAIRPTSRAGSSSGVAIARTLATGAQVLLADEPTGNLDKANGDKLIEILGQLAHEQGHCVIIVTHDPSIAERSDKVWRMSDGVLIEHQLESNKVRVKIGSR